MKLVGQKVNHRKYGNGTIISASDKVLMVKYAHEEKRYEYPGAFEAHLVLANQGIMDQMKAEIALRKEQLAAAGTIEPATGTMPEDPGGLSPQKRLAENRKRAVTEVVISSDNQPGNQSAMQMDKQTVKKVGILSDHLPGKQAGILSGNTLSKPMAEQKSVAFKCSFCDGGKGPTRVGFNGICSISMIEYNIKVEKHVWCGAEACPCRKYYDGNMTKTRLLAIMHEDQNKGSVCYESAMLRDWSASAGVFHNGPRKGSPMVIREAHAGSLAALTTREPGTPEEARFIFAVFLVDQSYDGDARQAGHVSADPEFRLELTPAEAKTIKFWNYYANPEAPKTIRYGSGLHRYLSSNQAAQILRDVAKVKTGKPDAELARRLFVRFCEINGLHPDKLPMPAGALVKDS